MDEYLQLLGLLPKSNILHGGVETTPPPSLVCGVGIVLNPDNFLSATVHVGAIHESPLRKRLNILGLIKSNPYIAFTVFVP